MDENQAAQTTPEDGNANVSREGKEQTEPTVSVHSLYQAGGRAHPTQHILLVEDDPTLANLEAEILTVNGYSVVTVHSGDLAVATLRRSIPDLVVLDLELTGTIQGWDVLQELRTLASIPVLITSSSATTARKYMREETRLTLDHLPKPYPMQTLLKRVKRILPPLY
jgi:DNA-binding response OmpR family regulator